MLDTKTVEVTNTPKITRVPIGASGVKLDEDGNPIKISRKRIGRPPNRKKIVRRKPGTKSNQYFTMQTQDAIVRYQASETDAARGVIYVKEILPAFDALVENLINVYGFKVMHETKQDLKIECLEFLYTAVPKFDVTKGSKAFSYFNVVAKNWLTIKSKQNSKKTKKYISLDYQEGLSVGDIEAIERNNFIPGFDDIMSSRDMKHLLGSVVGELELRVKTDNEKHTLEAINIIIENLDDIDLLSKRAVLLYIREITALNSKQLSIVLSSLKKHYKELRKTDGFGY